MSTHRVLINAFELVAAKTGFLLQVYVTRKFSLITNKFMQMGKKGKHVIYFFCGSIKLCKLFLGHAQCAEGEWI